MELSRSLTNKLGKAADALNQAAESKRIDEKSRKEIRLALIYIAAALGDPDIVKSTSANADPM